MSYHPAGGKEVGLENEIDELNVSQVEDGCEDQVDQDSRRDYSALPNNPALLAMGGRCRPLSNCENSFDNKEIPDEPPDSPPVVVHRSPGPGGEFSNFSFYHCPAQGSSLSHSNASRSQSCSFDHRPLLAADHYTTTGTSSSRAFHVSPTWCSNSSVMAISSAASSVVSDSNSRFLVGNSGNSGTCAVWQQFHATVRERNASMLFNDLMADVWFVVGLPNGHTQRIPAHSYVLATGSTVFYAMFYSDFPKDSEILVPDVEPKAFRALLRYLYTDEIVLDTDTVLAVLYVAKKYMITFLIQACIKFLDTSLTAKNVCLLLSQSRLFEDDELVQRCWKLIDAQTELSLTSEGFLEIDAETLQCIITRETLNVKEVVLFNATLRWAKAHCCRQNIEPTPQNARAALANIFYLIRIPTMRIDEFADGPAQSGLLSPSEVSDVFLFFTAKVKPSLPFSSIVRQGLPLRRCHRFQSSAFRSNQWRYRGRCDSIQFCTDRRIFVTGLGLYGSSSGGVEYKVRLELKCHGEILAQVNTWFYSDGSSSVFPVFFDHPIQVEPDVYNTASVILDGNELSFFGQEGMTEVQTDSVFFQFQCSTESTNGTGVQGGQIPEILFYC